MTERQRERQRERRALEKERARAAKAKRIEWLHRRESYYWSNRETVLADLSAHYLERKLARKCRRCPADASGDIGLCERCAAKDRAGAREQMRRLRERQRRQDAAYQPLDEIIDLTRVRVLRFARRLAWFTARDLTEALGIADPTQRNTITQMLNRLVRAGRFERARTFGVLKARAAGAQYEYRITGEGCEEIDGVLRTETVERRRAA